MSSAVAKLKPAKRRNPSATYEAILDAAEGMMSELGPEGLTVSEVVHRAGVNRTTAYQHFRTREQVIDAVMARAAREVSRMLEAEMTLGERIDHMVSFHLEHPEVARLWIFQMLSATPLPKDESWERYLCAMRALAASDRTEEGIDPEMLGSILLGATLVWSLLARRGPKGEEGAHEATERFLRELKRLLLYGVLKPADWPELTASIPASAKETS